MCILFIAVAQHPKFPLIIAANRDEFHARPTQISEFWQQPSTLLAGRDLEAGGTWMGVTRNGRISALTNIRDPKRNVENAVSRGGLVTSYLTSSISNQRYTEELIETAEQYNGYNLLFGDIRSLNLSVFNNHTGQSQNMTPGYYGLSNASLDTPWPKIERGKLALADYCETHQDLYTDALFALLADQTKAENHMLPDTGVPSEWEKQLSSIFIQGETYGTRTSTLLFVDHDANLFWQEKTFNPSGKETADRTFEFKIAGE